MYWQDIQIDIRLRYLTDVPWAMNNIRESQSVIGDCNLERPITVGYISQCQNGEYRCRVGVHLVTTDFKPRLLGAESFL